MGDRYDVVIGHGVLDRVPMLIGAGAQRVLLITSESLREYADPVAAALREDELEVVEALVPDAESAKTADVLVELWGVLGRAGFTRSDAVVCVGGGTVTDLGGFVAATWLRGVPVVQVPTTLLAMVDAAVGGKTGINTAEGKNLVGAFHEPAGVLCDLSVLRTLPRTDLIAGLAEVIKGGFIADPRIVARVEASAGDLDAMLDPDGLVLRELVERKIAVKASVVAADLRESHLREILNYGHTMAHAIEQAEHYRMRHGEAVAIGMTYAARLGELAGITPPELVARQRAVLESVGLPTTYDGASFDELLTVMGRDKKSRGSQLRFVVLQDIGVPTRLEGPEDDLLREAFAAIRPDN